MATQDDFNDVMTAGQIGFMAVLVALTREVSGGRTALLDKIEMSARRVLEEAITVLPSVRREEARGTSEAVLRDVFRNARAQRPAKRKSKPSRVS